MDLTGATDKATAKPPPPQPELNKPTRRKTTAKKKVFTGPCNVIVIPKPNTRMKVTAKRKNRNDPAKRTDATRKTGDDDAAAATSAAANAEAKHPRRGKGAPKSRKKTKLLG